MAYHVSKAEFTLLVEQALDELPEPFVQYMEEISIEIRDRPTRKELHRLGLGSRDLLLGLYSGRPRTQRVELPSCQ